MKDLNMHLPKILLMSDGYKVSHYSQYPVDNIDQRAKLIGKEVEDWLKETYHA